MQIHELNILKKKSRKRIGRGGKRGTTSGRGSNGQKSRSGASVDPLFEGGRSTLIDRMKKLRGFKARTPKKYTVTLEQLEHVFVDGEVISIEALMKKKIVRQDADKRGVKIVASGTLTKKLSLGEHIDCSEGAKSAFQI